MTTTFTTADSETDSPHPDPAGGSSDSNWRSAYAKRLIVSDLIVLVIVVFGAQIVWFGLGNVEVAMRADVRISELSYWIFSTGLVLAWMWALSLIDSRSHRVIGTGTTEYRRVFDVSLRLFGFIAICAFLLRVDVARGFLLISLPLGIVSLVLERWLWRQWINRRRRRRAYCARVLLVGSEQSVGHIARELQRTPEAGYLVVGACVPTGKIADRIQGTSVPIMGSVDSIGGALAATGADTVAVTSTDDLPPSKVKEISWGLEPGRHHLVLAPSIADIAGPRIHIRPVAGLPLIHVETPKFTAGQRLTKRLFDLVFASFLVVMLSPAFLLLATSIKIASPGPAFFWHERIGIHGRPFRMLKFRSMRVGAEDELESLLTAQAAQSTPLFKLKNDPRITPIGRFIRKYSLDELPQLFNVIAGSMSLVGPRPQIAAEVALYSDAARRRLLARPGITGLWQVSGRSTLSWEDAVRLDLYYVENWSLAGDIAILAKTAGAVLVPGETAH